MRHLVLWAALLLPLTAGADEPREVSKLKVRLARLKLEIRHHTLLAQRHRLEARALEIEAEKVRLTIELEALARARAQLAEAATRAPRKPGPRHAPSRERPMPLAHERALRHLRAGASLENKRQLREALEAYDRAVESAPKMARPYLVRGKLYRLIGKLE